MDLRDTQRRAREPFAKVCDVLADQVTRRRDERHVGLFFEDRVDRDAQHDFGFTRSGRRLEEKLGDVIVEPGADRIDRGALILGERERLTRGDEFMCDGDRLRVAVDRRPNVLF